jgi:hypothetical protein
MLRQEIEALTQGEPNFQKTGKELKKPEYKIIKLLTNDKDKFDPERDVMSQPETHLPGTRNALKSIGLIPNRIFSLKEYQVVPEKLPTLTSSFPVYQARTAEQEEKARVVKPSVKPLLDRRVRKIEPHQTLVPRYNLIEREKQPKIDLQHTFSSYGEINFQIDELLKEREQTRGFVSSMDQDSARRYDQQLIGRMWANMLLNIGKVSRYYQK